MPKAFISVLSFIFLFTLAACGQDHNAPAAANETNSDVEPASPTEISESIDITDAAGNQLTFDQVPTSFATFDSGVLDILLALDANVTGRPTASGEIESSLQDITEIGNPHQPNFEIVAQVNPDVLVVPISLQRYEETFKNQDIQPVYTQANSITDIQDTIHTFGVLLDKKEEADKINQTITDKINEVNHNDQAAVHTLLVYGAPGTYLAALPNSLSGDILEQAGGVNIAADFPKEDNYPQYASMSSEKIIERNPELILLITHGDPEGVKTAFQEEMNKNATWKNLDAVKNDRVIVLPSDLFGSNPGTKIAEALEVMQDILAEVDE